MNTVFAIISLVFCCFTIVFAQYSDPSVDDDDGVYRQPITSSNNDDKYANLFNKMKINEVIDMLNQNNDAKPFASTTDLTPEQMLNNVLQYDNELDNITFYAKVALRVADQIAIDSNIPEDQRITTFQTLVAPTSQCPFPKVQACSTSEIYRRGDGTCTNFREAHWGRENMPYKRFLRPRYQNGLDAVQVTGKAGHLLPNPRSISLQLCNDNQQFDLARTGINSAFGQFIDHDFTSIASNTVVCSTCNNTNPECISIRTPSEDGLNRNDQSCMTSRRSAPTFTNAQCGMAWREQTNILTPAIDLSQVYGPNLKTQRELRTMSGGLLKATKRGINGREYLPPAATGSCRDEAGDRPCFLTADGNRANINMHLTAQHMLWLREHNRIARRLAALNPSWNDEKIFQEARRINTAQMQNIIYSEWLPVIIGWNAMEKYDLMPSGNNYYRGYNDRIDINVYNEFTTAAFRLHTLVRTTFTQVHPNFPTKTYTLQDITFRAVPAYEGSGLDGLIHGSLIDTVGKFDSSLTSGLQSRLFEVPGQQNVTTKRFDLAALNINRCRDHGCAPFIEYREWCGLGRATKFSDLVEMDVESQNKLASIYKDVANIELFVGGLSERPLPGAVVGPTFACMIARQFRDFKRGDRFFFENPSPINPKPFTLTQLAEIHKIKLSTILCENIDGITSIQPNAFLASIVPGNSKISCASISKLNLNLYN